MKKRKNNKLFHPGKLILDGLEMRGITVRDAAKKIGVTETMLGLITKGKRGISFSVAKRLPKVLRETRFETWATLQFEYDVHTFLTGRRERPSKRC